MHFAWTLSYFTRYQVTYNYLYFPVCLKSITIYIKIPIFEQNTYKYLYFGENVVPQIENSHFCSWLSSLARNFINIYHRFLKQEIQTFCAKKNKNKNKNKKKKNVYCHFWMCEALYTGFHVVRSAFQLLLITTDSQKIPTSLILPRLAEKFSVVASVSGLRLP